MEKVTLRPVAITDLNIRYARHMGGNKVRHYTLPALMAIKEGILGNDLLSKDFVARYIRETEGVEVEFLEAPKAGWDITGSSAPIHAEDVTKLVFDRPYDQPVIGALKKAVAKSLIVPFTYYEKWYHRPVDWFAYLWNPIALKFFGPTMPTIEDPNYYGEGVYFGEIPYQIKNKVLRGFNRVHFLTIACEFDELPEAFQALRKDLVMLHEFGLIKGNLSMPSVLQLADTVGLGKNPVALFCFPVIDGHRACKLLKKHPLELSSEYLKEFNVIYESGEGSINSLNGADMTSKYEIEVIEIEPSMSSDEARQAHIDSFESSKGWVNEVSSIQKEQLKKLEKESNSDTVFEYYQDEDGHVQKGRAKAVHVNVKLKRKE